MSSSIRPVVAGLVSCVLLVAGAATAQQLPGPAEPERVVPRLEPPPAPLSREAPVVVPRPEAPTEAPPGAAEVSFTLTGIDLQGVTVYGPAELLPLYEGLLGKEVTLAQVYDVAAAITRKYRNDGYVLSQAVVPAQRIQGGVVQIQVVEGFVDKVIIQGEIAGEYHYIERLAGRIADDRPLRAATLERYLLLVNDLPGVTATSALRPSPTEPGAADLVVSLEHDWVDGVASFDNRGSKFIGPYQASLGVGVNSLLGQWEGLSARALTALFDPKELLYGEAGLDLPVGTDGLRLLARAAYSEAEPGFTLENRDIDSETTLLSLGASYPFIRSRSQNLLGSARFDLRESDTRGRNPAFRTEDRIRALRVGANYDFVDTLFGTSVTVLSAELSQGFDIFGATDGGAGRSRPEGEADFTKIAAYASRLQPLFGNLALALAASGQFSLDPLLSSEEFGVGGAQFGRAYDPSEILGDHGIAGSIELQYRDRLEGGFLTGYQVYAFFDAGAVWNKDPQPGVDRFDSALSTGLGVRLALLDSFGAQLEVALPLNREPQTQGDKDPRVFFSLTAAF